MIHELSPGRSRLFIRARTNYTPRRALPFVELVIGPADFVNAGAMLRGIKQRVERASVRPVPFEMDRRRPFVDAGEPRVRQPIPEVMSR